MFMCILQLRLPKVYGETRPLAFIEVPWKVGSSGNPRLRREQNFSAFIQVCTLKQNFSVIKYRAHRIELCNFLNSFYEEGLCLCLSPPFAVYVLLSIFPSLLLKASPA